MMWDIASPTTTNTTSVELLVVSFYSLDTLNTVPPLIGILIPFLVTKDTSTHHLMILAPPPVKKCRSMFDDK